MSRFRVRARAIGPVLLAAFCGCAGAVGPTFAPRGESVAAGSSISSRATGRSLNRNSRKNSAGTTDWDSFGFDLQRTGYNPSESSVGVGNVGSLQKLWSVNVGFGMLHEPVFAYGVYVNGQATNMLYAGSENGATMYAINAKTGVAVWQDAVPSVSYTCQRQNYQFSIGETPAIDRAKNLLYFSDGHNQVHAVDLATGKEASGWPVTIADYRPDRNFMHGGLTYNPSSGLLYAVTSSPCDLSPWYGRIVAINTAVPNVSGTFFTMSGNSTQGASGGGVWGPGGASVDSTTNNVFIATGNADTKHGGPQNAGYAEQVIELSPTLSTIVANNYPTNIPIISGDDDFDFGATPLLFQPEGCPLLLAAVNKSGMFELYDAGSIAGGPVQYIAMSIPSQKGDFVGVPAYDPVTGYVYVGMPSSQGIYKPGLAAFSIQSNCTLNPTPVWNVRFGPDATRTPKVQDPRSPISVANGVVYVSNGSLEKAFAFDAATGAKLWTVVLSGAGTVGTVVADGVVYVSGGDGTITAWAPSSGHARKSQQVSLRRANFSIEHYLNAFTDREAAASEAFERLMRCEDALCL